MAWPGTILTIKIIKEIELVVPSRHSVPVNNLGIAVAWGSLGQTQAGGTGLGTSTWVLDPISQPMTPAHCSVPWRPGQKDTRDIRTNLKIIQSEVLVLILTKIQQNSSLSLKCLGAITVGDEPGPQMDIPHPGLFDWGFTAVVETKNVSLW